jgi:uncharacterized protein YwqG
VTARTADHLAGLASRHLDADTAIRWTSLLRPAAQLVPPGSGDRVVARLGGVPELPAGTDWPEWSDNGPLGFVAEVDLAALTATGVDVGLALPDEGRLLAFYFDDPDDTGAIVLPDAPESVAGSRLLHVTGTGPTPDATVELTAVQVMTWPDLEHPTLQGMGLADLPDPFVEALHEILDEEADTSLALHQVGGWAAPIQGPVELEVAQVRLGRATYDDVHTAEALRWRPLLQVDSDSSAGTCWGDMGRLHWLARTDGEQPLRLPDDVGFTWQCG